MQEKGQNILFLRRKGSWPELTISKCKKPVAALPVDLTRIVGAPRAHYVPFWQGTPQMLYSYPATLFCINRFCVMVGYTRPPCTYRISIATYLRQGSGHIGNIIGRAIRGRPHQSMAGIMDFPLTLHLPSTDKNSRHNTRRAAVIPMLGSSWFHEREPSKKKRAAVSCSVFSHGAWTPGTTSTKRHMMPLR